MSTDGRRCPADADGAEVDGKLTRGLLERGEGRRGVLGTLSAALEAFRPDLVMISAGFDGRKGHPCGRGELAAEDYEWLTREVWCGAGVLCVPVSSVPLLQTFCLF